MTSDWFRKAIPPMLAVKGDLFDSPEYMYEVKWDGTRCISFVDVKRGKQRLQNRRLRDITGRYPEIKILEAIKESAILDGEIVVFKNGIPSFQLLQRREHIDDRFRAGLLSRMYPAIYVVFDVLYTESQGWVLKKSLHERREILDGILNGDGVLISQPLRGKAEKLFKRAVKLGLEGIMAKKLDSPYIPGKRVQFWKKIKKTLTADCVIAGYLHGEGDRSDSFGSLVLGMYSGDELVHTGQVGTGFDSATLKTLSEKLRKIRTEKSPFQRTPQFKRRVQWVIPELVCEVEYLEITPDKKLRSPVFKRMRDDKRPEECTVDQIL